MTFFEMILKNGKEREREGNQTAGEKMGAKGREGKSEVRKKKAFFNVSC